MNNHSIKSVETSSGSLFAGPIPEESDLKLISPDVIWNLTSEFASWTNLEKRYAKIVLCAGINDHSYPKSNDFHDQLKIVVDALKNGKKVLVHCLGGIGRTSIAVACIKIILDKFTNEQAIQFVNNTFHGPETTDQVQFIKNFSY